MRQRLYKKKLFVVLSILFLYPSAFLYAQEEKATEAKNTKSEESAEDKEKDEPVKTGWNFNIFLGGGQASSKSNDDTAKADSLTQEKPSSARNQLIPTGELNIRYVFSEQWETALKLGQERNASVKYTFGSPISFTKKSDVTFSVGIRNYKYWSNPYRTGSDRRERLPYTPVYSVELGGIGPFKLGYSYMYQDYDDRDLEEVRTDIYGAPVTDSERGDLKRTGAVTKYSVSTGFPVYKKEKDIMVFILGGYNIQEYSAEGESEAYTHPGYNLGIRSGLWDFSLMLQQAWGVRQYKKENPVFRKKREDGTVMQMMMAEYKINTTYSVVGRVIQNNTESNINFYDAEGQIVMAGVSVSF
ncbi:hypothetical protein CHS0354_026816 [Potamilus streckersoni]|uniref:DUF3078 domain-containing protein n=1 Tax=Potamilus streckersoni TaxID=2493646 RepID=A0AAE0T671_9BIVA|nr:hypothetical protein CHS0354_026816 [Potamilus streckersoni]